MAPRSPKSAGSGPPAALASLGDTDCVAYVRVSTERQAGEVYTSLGDQRAAIAALAAKLGRTVGRWYADEGVSGATAEGRPAFSRLLADCAAAPRSPRAPGLVLVLNDSRWGRFHDPEQSAALRYGLSESGWLVRFVEGDDSDDPILRPLMRSMHSALASQYRVGIQRNARRGMRGTAEQGFWTTRAPFGYRRRVVYPPGRERTLETGVHKATDEKVVLVPGPADEVAVVRWTFQQYARGVGAGVTLGALAEALAEKWPARAWSIPSVRDLLKNPAYVGDVVVGRRPGDKAEQRLHRVRPESAWTGRRDAHEPLVARPVFDAVQDRLAGNAARPRAARGAYPLSGLVACAVCGGPYVGAGTRGASRGGARAYRCSRGVMRQQRAASAETPACPGPVGTVAQPKLEGAVIALVAEVVTRPEVRRRVAAACDRRLREAAALTAPGAVAARAAKAVRALAEKRDRLVGAVADGVLEKGEAAPQLAAIRRELAAAEQERDRAARFAASAADTAAALRRERDEALALLDTFAATVREVTGPELREILRPWLWGATFHKTTRELTVMIYDLPSTAPQTHGAEAATLAAGLSDDMPGRAARGTRSRKTSVTVPPGVTVRRVVLGKQGAMQGRAAAATRGAR